MSLNGSCGQWRLCIFEVVEPDFYIYNIFPSKVWYITNGLSTVFAGTQPWLAMLNFVTVTFLIYFLDKKFEHKHTHLMLTHPIHTRLSEAKTVKCQNILFVHKKTHLFTMTSFWIPPKLSNVCTTIYTSHDDVVDLLPEVTRDFIAKNTTKQRELTKTIMMISS